MKYISLYQNIIYIIIFIFVVFVAASFVLEWNIQKCENHLKCETMRTMPRPTRHPITEDDVYVDTATSYSHETLNDQVDKFVARFFDENNYPYDNTIDLYILMCVNKGNVSDQHKKRLNDVAYYFLTYVIPNIPSSTHSKSVIPPDEWPKIEWLSDSWFDYEKGIGLRDVYGNSRPRVYNNGVSDRSNWISGKTKQNRSSRSSGSSETENDTNNYGPNSALLNGKNNDEGGSGGGENRCGNDCPNACFANAIQAAEYNEKNNPYYKGPPSGSLSFADTWSDTTYSNFFTKAFGSFGTDSSSNDTKRVHSLMAPNRDNIRTVEGYKITNEPQTSNSTVLDNSVDALINQWFDPSGLPSNYLKQMFRMYTRGNPSIDDFHKNKLRDIVYYLMENIIAGLPTKGNPVSYVEWRPIRWLSHSEL
jgi:hypothetical protein